MRAELAAALASGALGLSSGLAYSSANAASTDEVMALAKHADRRAQHLRHPHAYRDRRHPRCDGRSLPHRPLRRIPCRDLASQVRGHCQLGPQQRSARRARTGARPLSTSDAIAIPTPPAPAPSISSKSIRESKLKSPGARLSPQPQAGRSLTLPPHWNLTQVDAARRLQPAGAIYHSIDEDDMRRILAHPATMIGSDGLPWDQHPHPRLWGAFPRVLGRYCRDQKLFSLPQAIHKMTTMPARRFGLAQRGAIAENYWADLVLFNPQTVDDSATFADPVRPAQGIEHVWVNGTLSYTAQGLTGDRAGRFLASRRNRVAPMSRAVIFRKPASR